MTARQFLALRSARATAAKLRKHQAAYADLPGFADQVHHLDVLLARIDRLAREQAVAHLGTAAVQAQAREELVDSLVILAGFGEGWAAATGNTLLRHRLATSRTDLLAQGLRLDVRADNLLAAAREALALGADRFGLTHDLVDQTAARLAAWTASATLRDTRDQRKTVTQELGDAVVETMTFLRDVMDPLMRGFLRSAPRFAEEYRHARRIGGRRPAREDQEIAPLDAVAPPAPPLPVAGPAPAADATADLISEGWVVDEDAAADAALEAVLAPAESVPGHVPAPALATLRPPHRNGQPEHFPA
jgi:hypothetical protein